MQQNLGGLFGEPDAGFVPPTARLHSVTIIIRLLTFRRFSISPDQMIKTLVVMVSVVTLAACAAVVEPMPTPDGKQGFSISCDGSADSWTKCYKAAAQACGGKYDVINSNMTSTPTGYGPMVTRNLIVSCKG
ncbi:hypothetical protein [Paraburkholderia sp. 40]|uniref:hypothetical protein n=1 Tax=Paraburkholderia sp. 40 TaxID=2991059 RepID=UPI003D1FA47F